MLVAVFLDRESVTRAATVYFPEAEFPFTRLTVTNLKLAGRNGRFRYTHLHDMVRMGMEIVDGYDSGARA